jgi:hypothetical protein
MSAWPWDHNGSPDDDADRLRAAVQDMRAELVACMRFLEDMHTQSAEWTVAESQIRHTAVRAAIAKATQP